MFELDGKTIRGLLLEKKMTLRELAKAARKPVNIKK